MVTTIHFKAGEAVGLNTVMADLVNMERLDIAIRIPSLEATSLELGQPVDINTTATPVWSDTDVPMSQRASVIFIGAQIDPLTDTLLVRASLNHNPKLRPGQFVRVRILVEERSDRLAVPIESLVTREDISMIAIVEDNYAKLKAIKSGLREGNLVEVTGETLLEGMTIVTHGVYGLPAETRIRAVQ
jgi:membrane fusion protein (multidrug efflux system)